MDAYEEIQQNIAARKLNILKGFVEVQDIIEKGKVINSTKPAGTTKPAIEKEEPKKVSDSEFLGMKVDTKKVEMDEDEFVAEHKNLVQVLRSESHDDDELEAEDQEDELKEFKNKK